MQGLFQNVVGTFFGVFFSLFSMLFGVPWGGVEPDVPQSLEFPTMILHTASSQGEGKTVELSGYVGRDVEDPAFLKELLERSPVSPFSATAGERAEVEMEQDAGVYSFGWNDRPAYVKLWKLASGGELEEAECSGLSASNRFGVLQMSLILPEEPGDYLLVVHQKYNIGSALHLFRLSVGEAGTPAGTSYEPPVTYDFDEAKGYGYVVVTGDGVENIRSLVLFILDWKAGRDSSVYLIREGEMRNPAATLILCRDGRLTAYFDDSQAGGKIVREDFEEFRVVQNSNGAEYFLVDSAGRDWLLAMTGGPGNFPDEYWGTIVASTPREDGVTYLIYGSRTGQDGGNRYLNVFVDSRTRAVRAGEETQASALQLGDEIAVMHDPDYQPQTPNTVRAALVWAVPGGAGA